MRSGEESWLFTKSLTIFTACIFLIKTPSAEGCFEALGAESHWLEDHSFTASSFASLANDPSRARLNCDSAWVPVTNLNSSLQIHLRSTANVSGIALQGHPDLEYWVSKFQIQHSLDGENWETDPVTYNGCTDKDGIVNVNFTSIRFCEYIRINPTEWNNRVAIRLELFGCGQVQPSCGLRSENMHARFKRIVGGDPSHQGSWPWLATLEYNKTQWCGATLIAPEWIISGAHCFTDYILSSDPSMWEVVLGEYEKGKSEEFEQRIQLKEVYFHHKHNLDWPLMKMPIPEYDIVLIRLSQPAVFTEHIQPLCLLNPTVKFKEGHECIVTGWGKTNVSAENPETFPREVVVPIVSPEKCNSNVSYNGLVTESMLCAGKVEGGKDACQFDSGGPLQCEDEGYWYQTGIVSWGFGCASPYYYGVYVDMHVVTDWVKKMIENLS